MFKKLIDISWPISDEMTAYKNVKVVSLKQTKNIKDHGVHESLITLGSHTGTHIDAPAHFVSGGALIKNYDLNALVGPCKVIDLTNISGEHILPQHFDSVDICPGDRILFKTRNSKRRDDAEHDFSFIFIHEQSAHYLLNQGVAAVGIDYLGIERGLAHHPAHTIFFENGVTILEGLRLGHVAAGDYFLLCLPLAIPSLEAAPARAILAVLSE